MSGHDRPGGLRGDVARLFSDRGTVDGRPSVLKALERVATRPGPQAVLLYRLSRRLWLRGLEFPAELLWRVNYFLTGADIHPGAEIGGGLRLTHTAGVGWFDGTFADGFPEVGDDTEIMAGAKVLGPIKVGRGCFIGANAVLARDLPDGEAYTPGRETKELRERVQQLAERVEELQRELAAARQPAADAE